MTKEELINAIMIALATGNALMGEFMTILSGMDTSLYATALELQAALIAAAGGEETALGKLIKSINATEMTKEELISAIINAILESDLSRRAMRIMMKLSKGIGEYTSVEGEGGIKKCFWGLRPGTRN